MDRKILTTKEALETGEKFRQLGKTIVLAGGCFDILHTGHISFLEKAKKQGDILFVLLESDEAIKKTKGGNRPINTQHDRAIVLAALKPVDYVITLTDISTDKDYDVLISELKPAIIATTEKDPFRFHKERQARLSGATVVDVTDFLHNRSTTSIAKLLHKEL